MKQTKEKPFVPTYTYRLKQDSVWKEPARTEGITRYEKIPTRIFGTAEEASRKIAGEVSSLIQKRELEGKSCVLGIVTGFSPEELYAELVGMYQKGTLSFKNVHIFSKISLSFIDNSNDTFPLFPHS